MKFHVNLVAIDLVLRVQGTIELGNILDYILN